MDPELQEAMRNVKLDEGIFSQGESKEKGKSGGKKVNNKKKKGEDFLDYANKNGIELNLQYEDKALRDEKKAAAKTSKGAFPITSNDQPIKQERTPSTFEKKGYKSGYNTNTNSYNNPKPHFKKTFRTGNNKFDQCNMHLSKVMPMMSPLYNPYTLQGYNYTPNVQGGYYNTPNQTAYNLPEVDANSSESIVSFIEAYLSLDNLNQDLYLRNRIDQNCYIEISEIANHNKLRNRGVTLDMLVSLFSENQNELVETAAAENCLFLRNREWENLKEKLLPREVIQQNKRMMKQAQYANPMNSMNTMNYVSLQNNYFFNGMPANENLGMSAMYMGYQYPGMNMMPMQGMTMPTGQINPMTNSQEEGRDAQN